MHLKKFSQCVCFFIRRYSEAKLHHRSYSKAAVNIRENVNPDCMSAWCVTSYDSGGNVEFSNTTELPIINAPNQVLVKVSAASVNPLDVEMMRGYGNTLLRNLRQVTQCASSENSELPLILGRDFAGVVVAKGSLATSVNIGDEIYGVVKPHNLGCHAQYTVTSDSMLAKKPESLSMEKASAVLFTSLSAWSALKISGGLIFVSPVNKRCLVLGSSGGVGQAAVQLLNAWGSQAVATCSTDAIPHVASLSPDVIIDYTSPDYLEQVKVAGPYDIVLDAAGLPESDLLKFTPFVKSCGSLITLKTPLLANIDDYGLVFGSIKSALELAVPNILSGLLKKGSLFKWAYVMPCATAVQEISKLVNQQKIIPEIEQVYPFFETPQAYERVKRGHLRGKIVINIK